jgi:hypothetical protein
MKNSNDKFDLEAFKKKMGLYNSTPLQPYDFKFYRMINKHLTEEVYSMLRDRRCEWKIVTGQEVLEFGEWGRVLLPAIPHLDLGNFSANYRYYRERFHDHDVDVPVSKSDDDVDVPASE